MLVVVVAALTLVDPSQLGPMRGDVLAAALYVSNWWLIFHHVSYFASFGPPSPLQHLWSLAVEEQFYLLWPLLLIAGLRWLPRRWLVTATCLGAVASALAMAALYRPGADPNRVYYGTDTRAFELLLGAALALSGRAGAFGGDRAQRHVGPRRCGGPGPGGDRPDGWRTAIRVVDFLGAACSCSRWPPADRGVAHPGTRTRSLLAVRPLRWIGVRSYGIYLWHWPVIVLTTPAVTFGVDVPRVCLQVAASIALAALSWRFVEEPIRRGALVHLVAAIRSRRWLERQAPLLGWVVTSGVVVTIGVSCVGLVGGVSAGSDAAPAAITSILPTTTLPATTLPSSRSGVRSTPGPRTSSVFRSPERPDGLSIPALEANGKGAGRASATAGGTASTVPPSTTPPSGIGSQIAATVPSLPPTSGSGVTAIGDSVTIDAAPYLEEDLPGIEIDAAVGRQLYDAASVVQVLRANHELGQVVVLALGTNGSFSEEQLEDLVQSLGPVSRILLVNVRVPRPWQNEVNATMATVAANGAPRDARRLVRGLGRPRRVLRARDGVHLQPGGAALWAQLVRRAIVP